MDCWTLTRSILAENSPYYESGAKITYTNKNKKWLFNSSSFIGNEFPRLNTRWRYFHNFYSEIKTIEELSFIVGFDIGWEQKQFRSNDYNVWYSPIFISKFQYNKKLSLSLRNEFYSDKNNVIIGNFNNDFEVFGISLNIDYKIRENVCWRIEGRHLNVSQDSGWNLSQKSFDRTNFIATSLAIKI
jgi:hypothetical protein